MDLSAIVIPTWTRLTLVIASGVVVAVALVRLRPTLTGTTLIAPWKWAWFAWGASLLIESVSAIVDDEPNWIGVARYAAAVASLAPSVAVFGARRPQDRGWALIVGSLVAILSTTGAWRWTLGPGGPFVLDPAWRAFVVVLAVAGALNYLPTRFWPTALLFLLAQVSWFTPALGLGSFLDPPVMSLVGWLLVAMASALALARTAIRRLKVRRSASAADRIWLDFRDAYGAVWGVRIAERFNVASRLGGWTVVLKWSGLTHLAQTPPSGGSANEANRTECDATTPEIEAAMRQCWEMLLRRFVSGDWLSSRGEV